MNVETFQVDRAEAQRKLIEYRDALRRNSDSEFQKIADAYKAAAEGKAIVNVTEAICKAPCDEQGRPMLAMARSDRQQVHMQWSGTELVFDTNSRRGRVGRGLRMRIEMDRRHTWVSGESLVPIVPPNVRAKLPKRDLSRYHTLFEVADWKDVPPRDPFILQHIGGPLWAVLAEWDLTDIERAVLGQRTMS